MYKVKKWGNFYLPHQTWVNVRPGLCYQTVSWDRYRLFLDQGQQWHSLLIGKNKIIHQIDLRVRKKLIHSSVKFIPVSHARKSSPPLYMYLKTLFWWLKNAYSPFAINPHHIPVAVNNIMHYTHSWLTDNLYLLGKWKKKAILGSSSYR